MFGVRDAVEILSWRETFQFCSLRLSSLAEWYMSLLPAFDMIDPHGVADVAVGFALQQFVERVAGIDQPREAHDVPAGGEIVRD